MSDTSVFKAAVYDEEVFSGIQCVNQDLSNLLFRDCTFVDCDFSESKLSKTQFSDCELKRCNFSNAKLYDTKLSDVDFIECKLAGVDFTHCNQLLFSINMIRSKAVYCNFQGLDMNGCRLTKSELKDCVFEGANLSRADFKDSDLKGADFERATLESADFRGALNYQIDPQTSRVSKARFSYPQVLTLLRGFGVIVD